MNNVIQKQELVDEKSNLSKIGEMNCRVAICRVRRNSNLRILITIAILLLTKRLSCSFNQNSNNVQQNVQSKYSGCKPIVDAWTQSTVTIKLPNHVSTTYSKRMQLHPTKSVDRPFRTKLHDTTTDNNSSDLVNSINSESNLKAGGTITAEPPKDVSSTDEIDDDDDEYEYVEYDNLTEQDFILSEWMVGTNWDNKPKTIDETWVRLITDNDGKNVAIWGDSSKGTWTFDIPSQFLSISKENILAGKQIWACTISDNYYYIQGTVRGWTYWLPAAVLGQWQAKRLGVDPKEAGTPPWFETASDPESDGATTNVE